MQSDETNQTHEDAAPPALLRSTQSLIQSVFFTLPSAATSTLFGSTPGVNRYSSSATAVHSQHTPQTSK